MPFFVGQSNLYLEDPDVQSMLAVQAGQTHAYNAILERNYQRIYQFNYRMLAADAALAQDITQEVFLNLYQMAERYKPRAKVSTLLFQMARNACLNELRRYKPVSLDKTLMTDDGVMSIDRADPTGIGVDEQLMTEELAKQVRQAIATLPEAQRTAILLQRYEGMAYEDIAVTMKTTTKAIKSLINRAKANLADVLKKYLK